MTVEKKRVKRDSKPKKKEEKKRKEKVEASRVSHSGNHDDINNNLHDPKRSIHDRIQRFESWSVNFSTFNLLILIFWYCTWYSKLSLILLLCLEKKILPCILSVEFAEASKSCEHYLINHLHLKGLALRAYNFPSIICS